MQKKEIILIDQHTVQSISYSLIGLDHLTKDDLLKRVNDLQGFLPILLIIGSIFLYLANCGIAFLGISGLALIGLLFKGKRKMLAYRHIWSITAHAITMPVTILLWTDILLTPVPFSLFLLTSAIMMIVAMKSVPLPKRKTSEP